MGFPFTLVECPTIPKMKCFGFSQFIEKDPNGDPGVRKRLSEVCENPTLSPGSVCTCFTVTPSGTESVYGIDV